MKLTVSILIITCLCIPALAKGTKGQQVNVPDSGSCDSAINQEHWLYHYSEAFPQKTQTSLFMNISKESVRGSQFSLMTNFSNKNVDNYQLSFGYNHVNGKVDRAQISAMVNYANYVDGLQLAGHVNIAKYIRGWQISDLNFADTVKGVQLGFFNFANHIDGYTIGFLNFSRNGLFHLDVSMEETGLSKLTFASGKTFYTSYSLGYTLDGPNHPYSLGMGFGYHKDIKSFYVEGGFSGSMVFDKHTKLSKFDNDDEWKDINDDIRYNSLYQLNARVGTQLFSNIGIFGGVNYNILDTHGNETLIRSWSEDLTGTNDNTRYWPGLEVGIRIGR